MDEARAPSRAAKERKLRARSPYWYGEIGARWRERSSRSALAISHHQAAARICGLSRAPRRGLDHALRGVHSAHDRMRALTSALARASIHPADARRDARGTCVAFLLQPAAGPRP
jgi:hypothetical protein